jgi:hypothetical protein
MVPKFEDRLMVIIKQGGIVKRTFNAADGIINKVPFGFWVYGQILKSIDILVVVPRLVFDQESIQILVSKYWVFEHTKIVKYSQSTSRGWLRYSKSSIWVFDRGFAPVPKASPPQWSTVILKPLTCDRPILTDNYYDSNKLIINSDNRVWYWRYWRILGAKGVV